MGLGIRQGRIWGILEIGEVLGGFNEGGTALAGLLYNLFDEPAGICRDSSLQPFREEANEQEAGRR